MKFETLASLCPDRAPMGAYSTVLAAIGSLPIMRTEEFVTKGRALILPNWVNPATLRCKVSQWRYAQPKGNKEFFLLSLFRDSRTGNLCAWRRKE